MSFLDYVFRASLLVPSVYPDRPSLADPDDEMIMDLASQRGAAILTYNKRDFSGAAKRSYTCGVSGAHEENRVTVSINIPEDLYRQALELADSQQVSVDDVISSAFAQQMAGWERLRRRAARGSREAFLRVLDNVPDVEPEEFDRI
jgi:hypothetical protein